MRYSVPREKRCRDCGCVFMALAPQRVRCAECTVKARRAINRRYYYATYQRAERVERACARCGKVFLARTSRAHYCSTTCMHAGAKAKWRDKKFPEMAARRAARALAAAARKAAQKIPKYKVPRKPKRAPVARPARVERANAWMERVERDMMIADPAQRYAASRAWSARERAYAQKLALRAIGWRGAAY